MEDFNALRDKINGALDEDNLRAALASILGVSAGATVRRGKSIIAATESRSNVAYGTLPTADRVSGIVMPTDGWIIVGYQALWQEAVTGQALAAIFLGSTNVKIQSAGTPGPTAIGVGIGGTAARDAALSSFHGGLRSFPSAAGSATADVTTGQIVGVVSQAGEYQGGPCYIFAAAGTYDLSVQFRSLDASAVTVKARKLWVLTAGF